MRLITGTSAAPSREHGVVVAGYVVERAPSRSAGDELRYAVRAPDGRAATLVEARWPHADRRERSRFRRLARTRVELEHRAVIPAHTFGESSGRGYLITDEHPASSFADLLAGEAPLDPERVVQMLAPVAEALDLACSRGLRHEALDPHSLLLARGDRLLIGSFGILAPDDNTEWGFVQMGDMRYRSPEEVRGDPLGPAANVYSLTAIMVHALTGQPPFVREQSIVPYEHLYEAPPRVSERAAWLPDALDAVVERGLAKHPAERPESACDLVRDAALALDLEPPAMAPPPSPAQPPLAAVPAAPRKATPVPGPARRRRVAAGLAVAAACGAIAGLALDPFDSGRPAQAAGPERSASFAPDAESAAVWQRLAGRRGELRAQLAAAATAPRQAESAAALARAYDDAATAASPGPLTGAARAAAAAYQALADAANAADRAAYAAAGTAVGAAERRLGALARQ